MATERTVERVLRLLALLQKKPSWTASALADELAVTERSVRRDVERLRALGYPVNAVSGAGGGYRLGAGQKLPPLLLDDEEATATAISLRFAAGGTVSGIEESALSALTKLDQVMPPRLRGRVQAVGESTDSLGGAEEVDVRTLTAMAHACRDRLRIRCRYRRRDGQSQQRTAEPVRMVAAGWRWYLMAFDLDRQDWRSFRLDRMDQVEVTTFRFAPRDHPDPVQYIQASIAEAPYEHLARVRLQAGVEELRREIPSHMGRIEPDAEPGWALLVAGADDLDWMVAHLALLDVEVEVLEPPGLRDAAARLAQRLRRISQSRISES
ncbi:helix-turn-helix transcriptional regulator [Nesterenkonia lacusekhoensis]|uniref:DNA-binding transcriptional regulator YafY n=1 Tax=Nesterenkonia lacusekhoensis TaxID=150832 RepID=A0ABS4T300_9MICC|nr:WYL domain-containing protein [Nesterenkonia lacusekhoensis]MBP2318829.1 putative DNA-binding transcriptional regulator YafY [Nesterenkonia lacusekhoensis]